MPPSNVAPAAIVLAAARALVPLLAGNTVCRAVLVARASRTAAPEVVTKAASPMRAVWERESILNLELELCWSEG